MIVDAYEHIHAFDDKFEFILDGDNWNCRDRGRDLIVVKSACGTVAMIKIDTCNPPWQMNCRWSHGVIGEEKGRRIGTFNTETGELILDKVTFEGVPGVPEGWRLVRIGLPNKGEWYITGKTYECDVLQAVDDFNVDVRPIVERIPLNIEAGKWYQFSDNSVQKVTRVGVNISTSAGELWEAEHVMREVTVDGAE